MLRLCLFGSWELTRDSQSISSPRTRKEQWLLALLALRHDYPLERTWIAGNLWPDSTEEKTHYNLRRSLYYLRQVLGKDASRLLAPTPRTLQLDTNGMEVDVLAFDALLAQNTPSTLQQAIALYRGPLLETCGEVWIATERETRHHAYLDALERLATLAAQEGRHADALPLLRQLLTHDPFRETAHRALLTVLATLGQHTEVIQAYRQLRQQLHEELRTDPEPATTALYRQLRELVKEPLISPPRVRLAPLAPATPRRHLPLPLTSLIGREAEQEEVLELLAHSRLVTLTGAGGVGKTRLALAVANRLADQDQEVGFVELASLSHPDLVTPTTAQVLGVREVPGQSILDTLLTALQSRQMVLVLDNCEHLLEGCGELVRELLSACPSLRLLLTSRHALGWAGEGVYRVPSLACPPVVVSGDHLLLPEKDRVSAVLEYEAARLFVERAQTVNLGFRVGSENVASLGELCRRLDGIPLALELASGWVRVLSLGEIVARLGDRLGLLGGVGVGVLARHQTLEATLDWSYGLLSLGEQRLLRWVSVFVGGWTLEAVEQVCGGEEGEVLGLLLGLVDKSLVVYEAGRDEEGSGVGRYRLLETTREYGRRRLREAGEAGVVQERHARYYQQLVEEAERYFFTPTEKEGLERLAEESANLRAALEFYGEDSERALQMVKVLGWFWARHTHLWEGGEWLGRALAGEAGRVPSEARAKTLVLAGRLRWAQGDLDAAQGLLEESRMLFQQFGNERGVAQAGDQLSFVWRDRGDFAQARWYLEQGLVLWERLGDRANIAHNLHRISDVLMFQGQLEEARVLRQQSGVLAQELGMEWLVACSIHLRSFLAYLQGDLSEACIQSETACQLLEGWGDRQNAAVVRQLLGMVAYHQGDYATAYAHQLQALTVSRELGVQRIVALSLTELGRVSLAQGEVQEAEVHLREGLALSRQLREKWGVANTLEAWAALCLRQEEGERTACLLGASEALREQMGSPLPLVERKEHEQVVEAARAVLGDEAFSQAWAKGREMTWEQAAEVALTPFSPPSLPMR